MPTADVAHVFDELAGLLRRHSAGLKLVERMPGSTAKGDKPGLHLVGVRDVSIMGRPAQPTYIGGIIQQAGYVSFYLMGLYSHPTAFELSPALAKLKQGKSCLHVKALTPELTAELDNLIAAGIAKYQAEGWL